MIKAENGQITICGDEAAIAAELTMIIVRMLDDGLEIAVDAANKMADGLKNIPKEDRIERLKEGERAMSAR